MGNRLRDLRSLCGATPQEMVDTVRTRYPKYDKPLQSKCEHTDLYGVELTYPAFRSLVLKYCGEESWRKYKSSTDGHTLKCRIYGRLEEEVYRRFLAQIHQDGFASVQQWLTDVILAYINGRSDDP